MVKTGEDHVLSVDFLLYMSHMLDAHMFDIIEFLMEFVAEFVAHVMKKRLLHLVMVAREVVEMTVEGGNLLFTCGAKLMDLGM